MAVDRNILYRSSRMSSRTRVSSSSRTKITSKSTFNQSPIRGCTCGLLAIEAEGPPAKSPHAHALVCSLLRKQSSLCCGRERYQIHNFCVGFCALLLSARRCSSQSTINNMIPHMKSSFCDVSILPPALIGDQFPQLTTANIFGTFSRLKQFQFPALRLVFY